MTTRLLLAAATMFCIGISTACSGLSAEQSGRAVLIGAPEPPYFGQPTPGTTPALFAPGVVSTDAIELNGVFTPDGHEFFFTRLIDGVDTIHHSVFEDGRWSEPRPLLLFPDQARAVAVDMAIPVITDQ